jgi:hypothetical protein
MGGIMHKYRVVAADDASKEVSKSEWDEAHEVSGFIDVVGASVPSNPLSGTRRIFADTADGILKVRTPGGSTISLEEQGGGGAISGAAVHSLSELGGTKFTGDVFIYEGDGIQITEDTQSNALIITNTSGAAAGGGGAMDSLAELGGTLFTGDVNLFEGPGIQITENTQSNALILTNISGDSIVSTSGTPAHEEYFLVSENAGNWDVRNGDTGGIDYQAADGTSSVNYALSNLEGGRNWQNLVVVKGSV